MKVGCLQCGANATILTRRNKGAGYAELFCLCRTCDHTFVSALVFKHTIEGGVDGAVHVLRKAMEVMSDNQRKAVCSLLREFA